MHGLKRREIGQYGASDPSGVSPLGKSDDVDVRLWRSQGGDLLLQPFGESREHGVATGKDDIGVEILTDVDGALVDAVVDQFVNTTRFDVFGNVTGKER